LPIAGLNIPAIFVYGGTIKPGRYKDCDLTVVSSFEAVGPAPVKSVKKTSSELNATLALVPVPVVECLLLIPCLPGLEPVGMQSYPDSLDHGRLR